MKISLYQLHFAVNEQEYEQIEAGKLKVSDVSTDKIIASVTKEIEIGNLPVPHIGESINDSLWPSDSCEQKVLNVAFSYSEKICYLTLEPFVMPENCPFHREFEKIVKSHGWECQKLR